MEADKGQMKVSTEMITKIIKSAFLCPYKNSTSLTLLKHVTRGWIYRALC